MACDIIAASNNSSWKDELAKLIHTPRSPTDSDALGWGRLVDKAGEALVICHDAEDAK